ncbi:hypothetical protein [Lysinibacillus xylanilyticus]|uniref:hypothetical protein n=1 Tax=Lysinibacillus xylanilyticus TaxID=582475 RepID=UPI003D025232
MTETMGIGIMTVMEGVAEDETVIRFTHSIHSFHHIIRRITHRITRHFIHTIHHAIDVHTDTNKYGSTKKLETTTSSI